MSDIQHNYIDSRVPLIVLFDIESTSEKAKHAHIIQLAAQIDENWLRENHTIFTMTTSQTMKRKRCFTSDNSNTEGIIFNQICKPVEKIPEDSIKIHKITNNDVIWQQSVKSLLISFWSWIEKLITKTRLTSVILVAHNCFQYDKLLLQNEMRRNNVVAPSGIEVHWSDSMMVYKQIFYNGPGMSVKLETICQKRNVLHQGEIQQHDALEDVKLLQGILTKAPDVKEAYEQLIKITIPVLHLSPRQFLSSSKSIALKVPDVLKQDVTQHAVAPVLLDEVNLKKQKTNHWKEYSTLFSNSNCHS